MWPTLATLLTTLIKAVLDRLDHKRALRDATRLELERDATSAELEAVTRQRDANARPRDRNSTLDRLRDGTF